MFSNLSAGGRRAPAVWTVQGARGGGACGAIGYTVPGGIPRLTCDPSRQVREEQRAVVRVESDDAGTVRGVTTGRPVGRVEQIWLYPVRSLAGTAVPEAEVAPGGLAGDRAWTAIGADDVPIRPKDAPAMRDVAPSGDPAVDADRLTAVLGRPVRLAPTPDARPDVAPVHLVSREAVDRAAAGEVPEGCSAEDPRANLLLTLDGDERGWVGHDLRVGDAVLRVTRTPKHCLGVYADVVTPGTVRTGDPVLLVG
jgi:hypothetical protein